MSFAIAASSDHGKYTNTSPRLSIMIGSRLRSPRVLGTAPNSKLVTPRRRRAGPQGSGMGLAISRSIIESHAGHLWATHNSGGNIPFHLADCKRHKNSRDWSLMCRRLWLKQRSSVPNRDGEVRATELAHHGKVNSDHFALVIEEWTTGAARSGLGVIDDLVRQDDADVPLRGDGSD